MAQFTIHKAFFETREQVLEDLKRTGHWPTTFVSPPSPELPLHSHDLDVTGYVMSGGTYLVDADGNHHPLEPGDKLELPRGALHAEGQVTDTTVYIVGTERPGLLFEQLQMRDPKDPERIIPFAPS